MIVELFKHPQLPRGARWLTFFLLSYIFSPIDLIPDFIPLIGHWDDFLMIPIVLNLIDRVTPPEIIQEVRLEVATNPDISLFKGRGPKVVAIVILLIWAAVSWYVAEQLGLYEYFRDLIG